MKIRFLLDLLISKTAQLQMLKLVKPQLQKLILPMLQYQEQRFRMEQSEMLRLVTARLQVLRLH
nr:MAG TPA: hypothetical protein [Caudoviricetes sp.]